MRAIFTSLLINLVVLTSLTPLLAESLQWRVTWTVVRAEQIPCHSESLKVEDEYGRCWGSDIMTLEACFEFESFRRERYFETYEEAKVFVDEGRKQSEWYWRNQLKDFKIQKMEDIE